MKTTRIVKNALSIFVAVTVLFSGLPLLTGSAEASAASSYWKNYSVTSTSYKSNTIKWKTLTKAQQKNISGIAVYRGTSTKNMKLLKRIKRTSTKYVDTKAKAGKKYYYRLKTFKKKGKQYKYSNKSAIKRVITKKRPGQAKDSKFEVWFPYGKWSLYDGDQLTVTAESSGRIKWSSSDTSIATIKDAGKNAFTSHSGIITFIRPGKVRIIATNYDGQKKSRTYTVTGDTIIQTNKEPNYSYKMKFFNQAYTSTTNSFFLETDNPSNTLWDHDWMEDDAPRKNGDYIDIEVLDVKGNDVSHYVIENASGYNYGFDAIYLSPSGLYDDVQYTSWYKDENNHYHGEVAGGYLGRFKPPSAGVYTIQIREYSVNGSEFTVSNTKTLGTVNVLDKSKEYKAWMQQVIDNTTDPSMTKPEKMKAICTYLHSIAHYPDCLSKEGLDKYEERYGESHGWAYIDSIVGRNNVPNFVSHVWDSYTSPYCLEDFGNMIGYPVHSLYYDSPVGSADWQSNHFIAESVEDGSWYAFCPGDKTEYDLDEIDMIDPVTYQNYWLVLE